MSDIDQALYDRAMANMPDQIKPFPEWVECYERGVLEAARIAAERVAANTVNDDGYRPDARGRRGSDSTLGCASPFGEDDCAAWFQDSRRSSFRGGIISGWTRDKQHLWLCPECSQRVFELRVARAVRAALERKAVKS